MNKDLFKDVMKEKLEEFRLPADDLSWDEVESKLEMRKKAILFRRIAAAAVAACVAAALITIPYYQYINKTILPYGSAILSENEPGIKENVPEKTSDVLPVSAGDEAKLVVVLEKKKPLDRKPDAGNRPPVTDREESVPEPIEAVETKEEPKPKSPGLTQEDWDKLLLSYSQEDEVILPTSKKKRGSSIGLSVSAGNNHVAMNNNPVLASGDYNGLRSSGEKLISSAPSEYQEYILSYEDFQDISYSPPLSLGLSVRKELNSRFAIETGISYTYLASHFKNESPKREADLYLHYLGIPVSLVASLYSNHNWSLYVSVGGMIEKGVFSDYTQKEYGSSGSVLETPSADKAIKGIQLSAHLAPGVEYKLSKDYSIYLEPKVGYFFKNDQPVSIRTKHPLHVGLTAGLRFTL